MTTHTEETGETAEDHHATDTPTARLIGAVAMIEIIVVGETTPETVLVAVEMAHLTPGLAAGMMTVVSGPSPQKIVA
jgi:hypothetical protein